MQFHSQMIAFLFSTPRWDVPLGHQAIGTIRIFVIRRRRPDLDRRLQSIPLPRVEKKRTAIHIANSATSLLPYLRYKESGAPKWMLHEKPMLVQLSGVRCLFPARE